MKKSPLALSLLLAASTVSAPLTAAETAAKPAKGAKPAAADAKSKSKAKASSEAEMMKAWADYATPGEPHKLLERYEGSWKAVVQSWGDPSKPPEMSEGTMESRMVLGGRYLADRYEGKAMGQPVTGIGMTGYDNYKKHYFGTWFDSMGTGVMMTTGTVDATGKVMTSWGTMDDPASKKSVKVKIVGTWIDDDFHRFEMYTPGPGGKLVKSLEMLYQRQK
jgi:hypothetical protein